jgi:hypothetical protein
MKETTLGYYTVGGITFTTKSQAIVYASKTKQPVQWLFYNELWSNFAKLNQNKLGNKNLDSLYAIRAQQLRDKYDYLILHYSGGSDSHNILMTFLNNGIKLDEVCTFRSEEIESKIYTPNLYIKGAENIFSEWDYVTKPALQWLATNHPEIKITVSDMFKTPIEEVVNDDTFTNAGQYVSLFELFRRKAYSKNQKELLDQGKKFANIFGIDKPNIVKMDNICSMIFTDASNIILDKLENTDVNNELFYWSVDMPELPFEQAYQLFNYFNVNKNQQYMIDAENQKKINAYRTQGMQIIQKQNIYSTWDHTKFQANRANEFNLIARDRDKYYLKVKEIQPWIDRWQYYFNEWVKNVHPNAWGGLLKQRLCISPLYYIGTFVE